MTRDRISKSSHAELVELALQQHAQLEWFKRQLFGARSERRVVEVPAEQLWLGQPADAPAVEQPAAKTTVREHVRHERPARPETDESGLRFDASVPVETVEIQDERLDELQPGQYVEVSEKVTYRLAQRPGAYVVLKFVRKTIKRLDTGALITPPAVPTVLEKSYTDVSFLAGMLVDKFLYYLPLYRQHQRLQACGIDVSRSSLSNWVHRTAELLEPIYEAQLASILTSRVLAIDETPIRAGRKTKGKMRTAYFWPLYGDRNEVAFPYASSRAAAHVKSILGDFSGTLVSDGYDAYARFAERRDEIVHALCWVHARRTFVKAEGVEPELTATALSLIGRLYEIEVEIAASALDGSAKLEARAERSRPVVEHFFGWLEEVLRERALLPSNPFTQAANYTLERRHGLEVFLGDPEVPLDTNHLERALRPIPMGRKNWLFCWTEVGAVRVGQIQSLLSTCVLHEIDPYTYLVDVLQRIAEHPYARVAELTPREWKTRFAAEPMRSVLHWLPR
jgi:transposase